MKAYLELTKPRITRMILVTTAVGYYFGLQAEGTAWHLWTLLHTLLGTALLASGTAALNQWYERDSDAHMERTRLRPLPSGRITPHAALLFGMLLSVAGYFELLLGVNFLTSLLGLLTEVIYLGLYTPLKRYSWHSTTVGAVPGAMPPLIGFAAAAGTLLPAAWALFAILFVWQFPHFYAIAWMYREEYGRAGIRMLPVVEPDGASTSRQILFFAGLLIPVSLLPSVLAMSGSWYTAGALILGFSFLAIGWRVAKERAMPRARQVLLASVIYLPVLYGLMLLDRL